MNTGTPAGRIPAHELEALKAGADLVKMFEADGSMMVREGSRLKCCCPFHQDGTPSCEIYPDQNKYHCHGCKASGDVLTYLNERRGLDFWAALAELGWKGEKPKRKDNGQVIMPVPQGSPRPRAEFQGKDPEAIYYYRDTAGQLLMATARYAGEAGKTIKGIPWVWLRTDRGEGWRSTKPDINPLYGLEALGQKPDALVVIVEGEKTRDAAVVFYPGHAVVAYRGTTAAEPGQTDWSPLKGRRCLIIPDADWVGAKAAQRVLAHAEREGFEVIGVADTAHLADTKKGWDLADTDDQAVADRLLASCEDPTKAIERMLAQLPPPDKKGPGGKKPAVEPGDDVERGDILLASRFVADHREQVRYCPELKRWHVWDGMRWKVDIDGAVLRLAQITARAIAAEHLAEAEKWEHKAEAASDPKDARALWKLAHGCQAKAERVQTELRLHAMMNIAQARLELVVQLGELDRHDYLLNTPAGTYDLRSGQIKKHNPADLITKITGCAPKTDGADARLGKIVTHVTNRDPEVATYAQDILGQSIFGHNRLEKVYLWWGPGRSGKGTLMEAVKAALGDYALKAEFQSFIQTQGQRVRDDLDRLKEARIVLASEVEKGATLAAAVLKEMSGGDTIASRQLYGTYNEFRPRMTLHLQANDRPRVDDTDSGMWNRLVCIPCGPTVPEDQRDPDLKAYLLDPQRGGPAVLAWLMEGAKRTSDAKRIPMPQAVAICTAEYNASQNPLADWLRDSTRLCKQPVGQFPHKDVFVAVSDLNEAFTAACDGDMVPSRLRLTGHGIAKRLERYGCTKGVKRAGGKIYKVWFGITLWNVQHELSGHTAVPGEAEHLAALGVTELPSYRSQQPSICARARGCVGEVTLDGNSVTSVTNHNSQNEPEEPPEPRQQSLDLSTLPDPDDLGDGP